MWVEIRSKIYVFIPGKYTNKFFDIFVQLSYLWFKNLYFNSYFVWSNNPKSENVHEAIVKTLPTANRDHDWLTWLHKIQIIVRLFRNQNIRIQKQRHSPFVAIMQYVSVCCSNVDNARAANIDDDEKLKRKKKLFTLSRCYNDYCTVDKHKFVL